MVDIRPRFYQLDVGQQSLMIMKLEKVVPFGRSMNTRKCLLYYLSRVLMRGRRIVDIADGPASINAEMLR